MSRTSLICTWLLVKTLILELVFPPSRGKTTLLGFVRRAFRPIFLPDGFGRQAGKNKKKENDHRKRAPKQRRIRQRFIFSPFLATKVQRLPFWLKWLKGILEMGGSDDGAICFSLCRRCVCCFMIVMTLSTFGGCSRESEYTAQRNAEMEEHGGTFYGELTFKCEGGDSLSCSETCPGQSTFLGQGISMCESGYQHKDSVCPTNNTCTWAHDGVCDDASGVCAEGTDCEDCGTCNWYRCVSKAEVPKPTTLDKCENWTQAPLITRSPTPSPPCTMHGNEQVCR